jgi:hypothetical protein
MPEVNRRAGRPSALASLERFSRASDLNGTESQPEYLMINGSVINAYARGTVTFGGMEARIYLTP